MTVFKHNDGWRAVVYMNGKRVASKAGFTHRGKAKDWHDTQQQLYKAGDIPLTDVTFSELLARFIEWHMPTMREGSRVRYQTEIDRRIKREFSYLKLTQITSSILEVWKAKLGEQLSARGANYCLHVMRTILNRGVKWKLLRESPYGLDSFKVPEARHTWWDDMAHITRFLETARERSKFYPVYFLALETGMRYGEILGLRRQDVDLGSGQIRVERQWLHQQRAFGPPKHGKARSISFNPTGELGRVLAMALSAARSDLVFASKTGRPLSRSVVASKVFKSLQKQARVPTIGFHDMRHTFASWYMRKHDNVWDLKSILGHADIKTTQRYAHHGEKTRLKPLDLVSGGAHGSLTDCHLRRVK